MLSSLKRLVRERPSLFRRVYPIYTRLNIRRREAWKRLAYGRTLVSAQAASHELESLIRKCQPFAAGKIGTSELTAIQYALAHKPLDQRLQDLMVVQAGVFPYDQKTINRFQAFYAETLAKMTYIAVWGNLGERQVIRRFAPSARLIDRKTLEPHKIAAPWTRALEGKRIVVVSPFNQSIEHQYLNRRNIWQAKPEILPDFDLNTVRAPFSPGLVPPAEADWFQRFDNLWSQINARDFDICLVGAGALSLPITAKCVETGRIGIHMGGTTQIQFGIWGRRWDHDPALQRFKNEHWVSPLPEETPTRSQLQDNNSYW